jgi:hypothetical protein
MTRWNDPLRIAAAALARGDTFFEIQRPLCDVTRRAAGLTTPSSQRRRDGRDLDFVAAIESLGWRLAHVDYLYVPLADPDLRPSRRQSLDFQGAPVGAVLGAYLFQLADRPGRTTSPTRHSAELSAAATGGSVAACAVSS